MISLSGNEYKQARRFLWIYGLFLLAGIFVLSSWSKGDIHLTINQYHAPWADILFSYGTYLGDGMMFAFLGVIALFSSFRHFFQWLFTSILVLLFTGIFKQWLFEGEPRPLAYFGDQVKLYLVQGVDVHTMNSFPSGHTLAAFAIFFLITLQIKRWGLLWLFMALFVGYSRMYLSQHFLQDVFFGSLLGVLAAFLGYSIPLKWKAAWLDRGVYPRKG